MNRRSGIVLSADEQSAFLRDAQKAALATVDKDGFPHVVAMGFVATDGVIYMTSYAKAQKVVNVRRNPRVGVMIETGQHYAEFRGVLIRGRCEIITDSVQVETVMRAVRAKQGNPVSPQEALTSAPKRVVLRVTPEKIASWDHTKLGGKY